MLDLVPRGGPLRSGMYDLVKVVQAEGRPVTEFTYRMRFELKADGTGSYVRRQGLRTRSSAISWKTYQGTFAYTTICPDRGESMTYGYTYGSKVGLVLFAENTAFLLRERS